MLTFVRALAGVQMGVVPMLLLLKVMILAMTAMAMILVTVMVVVVAVVASAVGPMLTPMWVEAREQMKQEQVLRVLQRVLRDLGRLETGLMPLRGDMES